MAVKFLSGLEGTASAFAGQTLEGMRIKQAAKHWGIFKRDVMSFSGVMKSGKINDGGYRNRLSPSGATKSGLVNDGGRANNTPKVKKVLGASHVETLNINKSSYISTAPQEDGAFLSYNKVQNPQQFEIRLICDGSDSGNMWENMLPGFVRGLMGDGPEAIKKAFISELDKIVEDTGLYYVSTPEKMYRNANIIGYRIHRAPDVTSDMLIADITLQEVRQAGVRQWKARYPQGAPKTDNGHVQLQPVSDASAGSKV